VSWTLQRAVERRLLSREKLDAGRRQSKDPAWRLPRSHAPALPSRYPFQLCIGSSHPQSGYCCIYHSLFSDATYRQFCPQQRLRNLPFSKPSIRTRRDAVDWIYTRSSSCSSSSSSRRSTTPVELPARPVWGRLRRTVMTLVVEIKKRNRAITSTRCSTKRWIHTLAGEGPLPWDNRTYRLCCAKRL